ISESHALRQIDGLRGCSYTRMRTRLGAKQGVRRQRMGPTSMRWVRRGLVAAVIAVLLASCSPMQVKQSGTAVRAQSAPCSFSDPDDVNLPLDLKTLTHENDDATITYTVETYDPFEDRQADFKWAIDKDNDQKVDMFVS